MCQTNMLLNVDCRLNLTSFTTTECAAHLPHALLHRLISVSQDGRCLGLSVERVLRLSIFSLGSRHFAFYNVFLREIYRPILYESEMWF
jgi:hypothetical protein